MDTIYLLIQYNITIYLVHLYALDFIPLDFRCVFRVFLAFLKWSSLELTFIGYFTEFSVCFTSHSTWRFICFKVLTQFKLCRLDCPVTKDGQWDLDIGVDEMHDLGQLVMVVIMMMTMIMIGIVVVINSIENDTKWVEWVDAVSFYIEAEETLNILVSTTCVYCWVTVRDKATVVRLKAPLE